jgi:twitching motility protein PilT
MAWIDNLLSIVVERGADELRVAAGQEPLMFAGGAPRRLAIPKMSKQDVEDLLGGILSPERKALVASGERVEFLHHSASHGGFRVTITNEHEVSVTFVRADRAGAPADAPHDRRAPQPARVEPVESKREPHVTSATAVTPSSDARRQSGTPLLFAQAARLRASDLHLSNGELPLVRVDGTLRPVGAELVTDVAAVLGLSQGERDTLAARGSLDFSARFEDVGSVRVHVYRAASGLSAAVRLLPDAAPQLAKLGMPVPLDELAMLSHGLVLVTGPAGSGKSTTLAALAQEALRRRSVVLVTLEDPIELGLSPSDSSVLRRRQVGRDVATFAAGLRDALREDPDVLVVGEMRDPETIALALTAAETGHLVLGSLHSRSASSAVQRIFDSYPPERQPYIRAQLAEALSAVVSQRLVARAGGAGRVPVLELLRVTTAVANTIREGRTASIPSLIQSGRREGMLSLERCLSDRVRAGEIRLEDARALASDAGSLTTYLND